MNRVQGMTDLHHHILPGVDDGARDVGEALALAQRALDQGITTVVATPHMFDGVHDVTRAAACEAADRLRDALAAAGNPLALRVAAEIRVDERLEGLLAEHPEVTLDGGGRYALIELPHDGVPPYLTRLLFRLRARGTTPVIAHPERNLGVRADPEQTKEWLDVGAMLQLTAAALDGSFGAVIGRCARTLLAAGRVHWVATDAHRIDRRPPHVGAAFEVAEKIVGIDGARALFVEHPAIVAAGGSPESIVPPRRAQRRGLAAWLGLGRSS
ncbi:MAG: capsular biosynthesis protein [Planctomycetes bacterium]|nr:capsular biosynthesis protein [Planctomycetota bacterium]